MKRRDVVASIGASFATVGLAGCTSVTGGCGTPPDDLDDVLPEGGDFVEQEHLLRQGDDHVEQYLHASIQGPEGRNHVIEIVEFTSEEWATDEFQSRQSSSTSGNSVVGILRVGSYIFSAVSYERSTVKTLLSEVDSLSSDCVESNVVWDE